MADTTFVNAATLTDADWFNDLNRLHYTIFGDPADAAAARTALGAAALAGATFTGLVNLKTGANIASAATINLSTATGNLVHITGTTATSAVTMNAGQWMRCIADGAWPLTYHATTNHINSGATNITLAAGDIVDYFYDGTTVWGYVTKADGTAVISTTSTTGTQASTFTFNGSGGTTASVTMSYQKIGNWVTLRIPPTLGTSGTSSTVLTANTALPAAYRPAASVSMTAQIYSNNAAIAAVGLVNVPASGLVSIFKGANLTDTFANSTANCGLGDAIVLTYPTT